MNDKITKCEDSMCSACGGQIMIKLSYEPLDPWSARIGAPAPVTVNHQLYCDDCGLMYYKLPEKRKV